MAELCDVCKKPLEWPTDGDPTDDFQTSICRHMVRSAPTASPKASEGADPSESEFLCSLLPKLDFIERLVLKQDHARGRSPFAGKVREISTAIIQRVENTRVAPAPDPHSCDEVLIAKYLQDPEWAARFRAEVARLDAPDPRVEEIRKRWECLAQWANSDFPGLQDIRYLLSKLDGKEQV